MSTPFKQTLKSFESKILYFNGMYKLPIAPYPTVKVVADNELRKLPLSKTNASADLIVTRLKGFKATLLKEVEEVGLILNNIQHTNGGYEQIDFLTDMADWLGDIQVYCASEMVKFGIPIQETLDIIMSSNFSKLQADGSVEYDEHGKVQKGPGYWKPEPMLKEMLLKKIEEK